MKAVTKSIKSTALASAVFAAGLVMSTGAFAGGTASLTVNAKILATCSVTTAPGTLDFGTIDPSGGSNVNASATFTMKCSNGTTSTAATDGGAIGGAHSFGGFKRMQHSTTGTAFLPYAITYTGDTGFAGAGFSGAGTPVTINGTITPAQYAGAIATTSGEVYADTVTITVNP
jgi:spore coat protein U-like protein